MKVTSRAWLSHSVNYDKKKIHVWRHEKQILVTVGYDIWTRLDWGANELKDIWLRRVVVMEIFEFTWFKIIKEA